MTAAEEEEGAPAVMEAAKVAAVHCARAVHLNLGEREVPRLAISRIVDGHIRGIGRNHIKAPGGERANCGR